MLLVIQKALGLMIIYVQLPSIYKYILNIIIYTSKKAATGITRQG